MGDLIEVDNNLIEDLGEMDDLIEVDNNLMEDLGKIENQILRHEIMRFRLCFPGGSLLYLYTGMCIRRVKFKPKKIWTHCKFCTQRYCDPAYLLPKF